jgi:hypothetical protein
MSDALPAAGTAASPQAGSADAQPVAGSDDAQPVAGAADTQATRPADPGDAVPLPADPQVRAAALEVAAARSALDGELALLRASARAAVDIKAKVRRHPGRSAAIAGGTAFLALGGPRRLLGSLKRRLVGPPEPLPSSLLPDEIERAVRALGEDGAKVRGALERGFAGFLEATSKDRKADARRRSLIHLATAIGRPLATRAAREAAMRLVHEAGRKAKPAPNAGRAASPRPDAGSPTKAGQGGSRDA